LTAGVPRESESGARPESGFEGGEKQVEEFGSEAEGSEKGAVLAAERGYLSAMADEDYETACSLLSKSVSASLQDLVESGRQIECEQILPHLISPSAAKVSAQQADGEVVRVRVHGERAIVVFRAPGARLWAMPLSRQGDAWKVTALGAAILAPSSATIGE
jgi:hypothetical protein